MEVDWARVVPVVVVVVAQVWPTVVLRWVPEMVDVIPRALLVEPLLSSDASLIAC